MGHMSDRGNNRSQAVACNVEATLGDRGRASVSIGYHRSAVGYHRLPSVTCRWASALWNHIEWVGGVIRGSGGDDWVGSWSRSSGSDGGNEVSPNIHPPLKAVTSRHWYRSE